MSHLRSSVGSSSVDRTHPHTRHNHAQPIFKLPSEVLWYIFSITAIDNGYFAERIFVYQFRAPPSSALVRARSLSQVCSAWRELVLASSSLWANSIEMRDVNQIQGYWREELLRRTGNAPLSIKGVLGHEQQSTEFLLELLSSQWPRFRRLNIMVTNLNHEHQDRLWLALGRPAHNLELLHISFWETPDSNILATESGLFSNKAPNLRSLRIPDIHFNLASPWISQLRELSLRENFTAPILLRVLRDMPTLEVLEIDCMDVSDSNVAPDEWPTVTLPSLKSLTISDKFHSFNSLLQYMIPPAGCNLYVESTDNETIDVTSGELSILSQSFVRYFKSYSAQTYGQNQLSIIMSDQLITIDNIRNSLSSFTQVPLSHPHFRVDIEINFSEASYVVPCTIFRALSSCNLSMITVLHLEFVHCQVHHGELVSLMKSLSTIEVLHTESETLQFFIDIHDVEGLILPSLHTIVFDTSDEVKSDVVIKFLIRRREAQSPIKIFDLTKCTSFGQAQLLFLEGIDGLKVIWDDKVREEIEEWRRCD